MSNLNQYSLVVYLLAAEVLTYAFATLSCVYFSAHVNHMRKVLIKLESGVDLNLFNLMDVVPLSRNIRFDTFDWLMVVGGLALHFGLIAWYITT